MKVACQEGCFRPGAAPLRMETDDQRKFGYGGDGLPPSDGDDDGSWEPGGDSGAPNPYGLFILLELVHGLCGNTEGPVAVLTRRPKRISRKKDTRRNLRPGKKGFRITKAVELGL